MTTEVALPAAETAAGAKFETGGVLAISTSHLVHDTYTAFVSPLLPLIIEKLTLSLTQAGFLAGIMQFPSIFNPLIGYLNEKYNLRWLMILTPAISATLITSMGLAPNYITLVLLLTATGASIAVYHAIAPALLASLAGKHTGRGMSFFMAGGELGRTLGPLVSVWLVSLLSLRGLLPAAAAAWLVSLSLLLVYAPARKITTVHTAGMRSLLPQVWRFFLPLAPLVFCRSLLVSTLGIYLPTYLNTQGSSLAMGGAALSLYQFAGVIGALAGGTLSDRLGRRWVAAAAMLISSLLTYAYLNSAAGWISFALLIVIGFANLSIQPVLMALVQDYFPQARSMANGFYLGLSFISLSLTTMLIGAVGEWLGLRSAFLLSAGISLLALPMLLLLPARKNFTNENRL